MAGGEESIRTWQEKSAEDRGEPGLRAHEPTLAGPARAPCVDRPSCYRRSHSQRFQKLPKFVPLPR